MDPGILYISYDGVLEPLGQSQVVAYLERLAPGRRIHLISFEKPADWSDADRRKRIEDRLSLAGIRWHPLRYHKSPSAPATAYDIAAGFARAVGLARRHRLSIVHARSYVPGLIALAVKRMTGARFLFDMRGFWADERVDGGLWPRDGALYRAAKHVERSLLLAADHVVTLTNASAEEMKRWPFLRQRMPPISVIPTCADLDRFTIQGPPQRDPFVLGYVGSVGTWYLLDEMLRFFAILRENLPDARLLIVNKGQHDAIEQSVRKSGVPRGAVEIAAAEHADIPRLIARMSAALAFYRPSYSRLACAPTKLAEYLGCGVPCVATSGVGDTEAVLTGNRVGVVLNGISADGLRRAVSDLPVLTADSGIQDRCRTTAEESFSLDAGASAYASIYEELA